MSTFELQFLAVMRDLTESVDALTDELRDVVEGLHELMLEVDDLGDNMR